MTKDEEMTFCTFGDDGLRIEKKYSTKPGCYLVIMITGMVGSYIAEVTRSNPLRLKVQGGGPLANLKEGDFIIQEGDSARLQKDCREDTNVFLESGRRVISGLKSLGVTDGKLHEILPSQE